ncbi:MAG: polymer-forming cytoskeletal protein [Myxococcales bacterium]|nr:polymer-forming cytoskeletal protein [Myxococcales bacterium]
MIGPGTTIRGNITGDEDLVVEGRIEGSLRLSRDLTVATGAVLQAEIEAANVQVSGRIQGNVTALETLVLDGDSVMVGDINTPRLHIADGARFKGRVHMDFEIAGAEKAPTRRR